MTKTNSGNYFEDFRMGQVLAHATPRTVNAGDVALYQALYGGRFALQSSDEFARVSGLAASPVDDWLVFHIVFGKTVPDISLNAVANLGYAEGRWLQPVFAGDTLSTTSTVIGLKENSNRQSGVVYVRSTGSNQRGENVLEYVRWVMVRKRDATTEISVTEVPKLHEVVPVEQIVVPAGLRFDRYDGVAAGSAHYWDDYAPGEKIDHVDGMTIEEAEHQLATRLYQNNAKVHFNQHVQGTTPLGRRLIYGGVVISLARALSFNGLGNAQVVAALNAGRHVNPTVAGDTIHAWSEVMAKAALPDRSDIGALRLRTLATKNAPCAGFPDRDPAGKYPAEAVLDLDYWVLLPRRTGR